MTTTPTRAPSWLGSLAAGLGLCELDKLISGGGEEDAAGKEVLGDCHSHRSRVSSFRCRHSCRFDHQTWDLAPVDLNDGLDELVARAGSRDGEVRLSSSGNPFVLSCGCSGCGSRQDVLRFSKQLADVDRTCARCGARLTLDGFGIRDRLRLQEVPGVLDGRPLSALGLRAGDVVSIEGPARVLHCRIATGLRCPEPPGAIVAVSGCGGNIGSHLTPHLGRLPGISRVILVDPDVYEARNLSGQDIRPEDVGRPKVQVQAERLRAIRPDLEVLSFQSPLEDVPLGFFEGAIAVSCLDSRIARVHLSERVWRVGAPLIDTAVDGSGLLYRATVYHPGESHPCYECTFEDEDYNLLETVYPCDADSNREEN